jgi:hypothetical protein
MRGQYRSQHASLNIITEKGRGWNSALCNLKAPKISTYTAVIYLFAMSLVKHHKIVSYPSSMFSNRTYKYILNGHLAIKEKWADHF